MLKVDAHQHFWVFDSAKDTWITEDMVVIKRDFLPEDLKPILDRNMISACVAIQAGQSESETEFLLELAEKNSFIKGVVGWIDLRSPDLDERLEHYSAYTKLKGFRHIVQSEEPGFMLEPAFLNGVAELQSYGYSFDILVRSSQIKEAETLVEMNPKQNFVLDHLGKPDIKSGKIRDWSRDIFELAAHQNVYCKLSGMVTEADFSNWTKSDLIPYMDVVMDAFGVNRLMFGSDWPVCKLAASYEEVCDTVSTFIEQLSEREQELIWSGNANKFYNLNIGSGN